MEFIRSETMKNLARAFAGESQARNRYTMYESQARKEGNEYLARIFAETAANELAHAKEFFGLIIAHGGSLDNIDFDAGYPFAMGTTLENLGFAAEGESQEHLEAYPAFARKAKEEGFEDVYHKFTLIAEIEGLHHRVFTDAKKQLADGSLYKKAEPYCWRCLNCGHVHFSTEPWTVCPVCGHDKGFAEGDIKKN